MNKLTLDEDEGEIQKNEESNSSNLLSYPLPSRQRGEGCAERENGAFTRLSKTVALPAVLLNDGHLWVQEQKLHPLLQGDAV